MKKPTSSPLTKLFSPTSIAVVGASRDEHKLGTIILRNIMQGGFTGKLFPINPQATTILHTSREGNQMTKPVLVRDLLQARKE
jgi:predicted CoA-binding protein